MALVHSDRHEINDNLSGHLNKVELEASSYLLFYSLHIDTELYKSVVISDTVCNIISFISSLFFPINQSSCRIVDSKHILMKTDGQK